MLQELTLNATKRETGKHISRQLRASGKIPGIFYSKADAPVNISVDSRDIRPIVYTSHLKLVNLNIEGEEKKCILKDVKFDPVTDNIVHFDLLGILDDRKITVEVPVEFTGGQPIGVRKGGKFQQVFHKCKITCLPKHLISALQVDISTLDVGGAIHLKDLDFEGVEYSLPLDSLLCAVNTPRGGKLGEGTSEQEQQS